MGAERGLREATAAGSRSSEDPRVASCPHPRRRGVGAIDDARHTARVGALWPCGERYATSARPAKVGSPHRPPRAPCVWWRGARNEDGRSELRGAAAAESRSSEGPAVAGAAGSRLHRRSAPHRRSRCVSALRHASRHLRRRPGPVMADSDPSQRVVPDAPSLAEIGGWRAIFWPSGRQFRRQPESRHSSERATHGATVILYAWTLGGGCSAERERERDSARERAGGEGRAAVSPFHWRAMDVGVDARSLGRV